MCPTRVLLGLLLGTCMLLGLAGAPPAEAQTPKRGGTLRVSYGNEIAHLDFHTAPGYEMMWVAMNVGCGLVNITPDGKFVGDAAESWQVSSDGLLYTFKLKKNVLFHDGTKVDAAAVKFSIDRLMDPATGSGMRTFYESVHSVEALDPQTVQIRLKHPYAFMLHMLAGYRTGLIIYSPTATQKFTVDDRKQGKPGAVVGCGPFKLVEWVKGSHLVMDRFDKYFEPGLPYLDRVMIRVIKDPITEMAAFKAGEVDFIASFSPEHVDAMKAQNPRALIMTGKIVKIAFKGQATPWVGIIPPGTMDTVDVNHMCPYDQARAKALLAEAGYGPQKPLTFELMTNTEKSVFNVIATVIKEQMSRIGVTANIRLVDKVTWMTAANQDGPWDMYVEDLLSLLTLDSNAFLSTTPASWNHTRHTDSKVDDYYARYAREMDPVKRKAIAKEFQEFSADKLYWNAISGSPFYMVAQPWMKGYVYNAEFEVHWDKVWLDK